MVQATARKIPEAERIRKSEMKKPHLLAIKWSSSGFSAQEIKLFTHGVARKYALTMDDDFCYLWGE